MTRGGRRARAIAASLCVLALGAGDGSGGSAASDGPHGQPRLAILQAGGCPVRIVPRGTRVTYSLPRDPWIGLRGGGEREHDDRAYGAGESQTAFHLVYENVAAVAATRVVVSWTILDERGESVLELRDDIRDRPLAPRERRSRRVRRLLPPEPSWRYEVSIEQVVLEDGTVWIGRPQR